MVPFGYLVASLPGTKGEWSCGEDVCSCFGGAPEDGSCSDF